MTSLRTTGAAIALAVSFALGLTACGGEADAEDAPEGAAAATPEAYTADTFFAATTAASTEAGSYRMEMQMDAEGESITMVGDVAMGEDPEDVAMRMTMTMGSFGELEMRLVDRTLYMNLGEGSEDKFMVVDPDDPDDPLGREFSSMLDTLDPTQQLDQIQDAVTGFERSGDPETIDGVEATPYRITIDTELVAEQLGDLAEDVPLPDSVSYVFLVGSDDLPRRMDMDIAGVEASMTFSRWGEPVEVEAPAADEITDLTFADLDAAAA